MEGESILKKTLVTVAAMVGACVAFVGSVSIVAVVAVTHAVGGGDHAAASASTDAPAASAPAPAAAKGSGAKSGARGGHQEI